MGFIVKVLSFTRSLRNGANVSDTKADKGGGENITADHFSPIGDDSNPLPGDDAAIVHTEGEGRGAVVAYLDPKVEQKAEAGEKRIYARDENGDQIAEIWLKNTGEITAVNNACSVTILPDGSIKGDNGSGSFELQVGGDFVVNGVTIDTSGNISTAGSVSADSVTSTGQNVTLGTHTHSSGSVPAPDPGT